jgi:hypothetical protein
MNARRTLRHLARTLVLGATCVTACGVALAQSRPSASATTVPAPQPLALPSAALKLLPYQMTSRHLGVASCASSVCHGNVKSTGSYDVLLNEYIVWSHDDSHSKAYSVLMSERSRAIAAKLGLPNAYDARMCLDCHADNVPEAMRGKEFNIADGVGCEACHGGAERWIESHTMKTTTYEDNLKNGMYPTATLANRAPLCLSCHVGNADKFTTHRIMGAGHPRLSFELDTFQALQPAHHQIDKDYAQRKPVYSRTAVWAYGQIEAARMQVQLIQQYFAKDYGVFPELALFTCHSCHQSSMRQLDWARGLTTMGTQPGSVPLNDGHLRMAIVIARQMAPLAARDIVSLAQSLQEASATSRERVLQVSGRLEAALRQLQDEAAERKWSTGEQTALLGAILDLGSRKEYRDYIGAEQAVMASELLMLDLGTAARNRTRLDALFRMVEDDETFRADQFVTAINQLRSALGMTSSNRPAGLPSANNYPR